MSQNEIKLVAGCGGVDMGAIFPGFAFRLPEDEVQNVTRDGSGQVLQGVGGNRTTVTYDDGTSYTLEFPPLTISRRSAGGE